MDSSLVTTMDRNVLGSSIKDNTQMSPEGVEKMNSSINSTLEDTTPSDSGVQLMDSESSEQMAESLISQADMIEYEEVRNVMSALKADHGFEVAVKSIEDHIKLVDDNSNNVTATVATTTAVEDVMTASTFSNYDNTESIVYRRKVSKQASAPKAPKKRVSFHEDILKSTRTDNIHIEHGFVTYKNGRKMDQHVGLSGRYSWCSEGDGGGGAGGKIEGVANGGPNQLCDQSDDGGARRRVVYRNACSDVLDYGDTDVFDTNKESRLRYDNSGVFEYLPDAQNDQGRQPQPQLQQQLQSENNELCRCSCSSSSSNSSFDSDENDKNCNRSQYGQAKSNSCDCIGLNNANNNVIGDNCYFSEPNMENLCKKSVWNKEKKPKSSCLKKTKRYSDIIQEQDLTSKVKKFNVHDMNQLLDNSSKMIFGSLRSIFTMPLPERGVPEGSEDLQSVVECIPELEPAGDRKTTIDDTTAVPTAGVTSPPASPPLKAKPFLSKSLDGSKQHQTAKKFVHNVDEHLRRKAEDGRNATASSRPAADSPSVLEQGEVEAKSDTCVATGDTPSQTVSKQFRNKFIINCESTVFEHTGVSFTYESQSFAEECGNDGTVSEQEKVRSGQTEKEPIRNVFIKAPITKTLSNFFRSFKDATTTSSKPGTTKKKEDEAAHQHQKQQDQRQAADSYFALKMQQRTEVVTTAKQLHLTSTTSSSTISELTNSTASVPQPKSSTSASTTSSSAGPGSGPGLPKELRSSVEKQSRHLASPLKKRASGSNLVSQPVRYGASSNTALINDFGATTGSMLLSPEPFNGLSSRGSFGRDSKSTILSEDFDDIMTITTDTDRNESDIVIVNYPEEPYRPSGGSELGNLLKPSTGAISNPAKTSLINRFLRNVTQKKMLESSIRHNNFFASKLRSEQKLFGNHLYVRGVKPKNYELIDDLNAEIAMEIEMSGANSPRRELVNIEMGDMSRFELGIGEISIDIFNGNYLHILRDSSEQLMKVFKLYTGYSREGYMTPVLVFLTDKTLYVTDLVRNRLCSKFVLTYADVDVILMGPYGNTVLLSNSARDMQQVLLAGGPYPADGLVANLESCARRSGSTLPAVGQLTLQHLAPLQAFVSENSCVTKEDTWMYYAVVNVPAGTIGGEREPLGPHEKGFLMHRRVRECGGNPAKQSWTPGYFLLKAGVLYMFNDSSQKLPSWAMALAECQGARRSVKAGRPHCFEIMLRDKQLLQLAAPDEYVASEWLQALLQAASGLFEMQEKHKTLGCTLIVTQNHLITLREDFNMPLRQLNKLGSDLTEDGGCDGGSLLSSVVSTPTREVPGSSSLNSTPTKMSQLSRSSATAKNSTGKPRSFESDTHMASVYGKNSGVEVLTCAGIKEMTGIKIPSHNDTWWCSLEFSCQEARGECSDDLVIFFASSSEMQRFLRLLEQLWQAKNNDLFPITVLDEDDYIAEQCSALYMDINRSWEPLLTAALGYPL